ncbi:hypothetical protein ACTXPO_02565 [Psychrobacter celer]|uniref:hypothetical protein n=1 Tax=Psychrobacter celer TaxID=306572 RepID=UPI003FCFDD4E
MALTTYHHGITATETSNITPIIKSVSMSTIALVSTSIDADDAKYPLDTPVLLTGITTQDVTNAGSSDQLLRQCLQTIKSIQNTSVVVLRLSEPVDVTAVDTLLSCQSRLGITPKIFIAPEIDTPTMTRKLVEIAKKRRGFVYASPRMEDGSLITVKEDIAAYRDTFAARELMLIENEWGVPGKPESSQLEQPNYINLTEPPVVASSIRFEDGYDVAACLKVQVNDGAPQINSFIAEPAVLTHASVTPDQVALSKLLQSFAMGRFPWGSGDLFMSETFTVSAFAVLPETIGDSIPQSFALAGLDDDLLKSAIAYMFSNDSSIDLSPLASMPASQLQSWIDATAMPADFISMTINNTPSKITISRTTQTEIDGLFIGDHLPHVDMFDVAKSLLTSQHVELNSRGFEPAKYIADRDVIELVSNYSLTIKSGVMEIEP